MQDASNPSPRREFSRRKWLAAAVLLLLAGAGLVAWRQGASALFPHRHAATVLVLDDCSPDFRNPPFRDALVMLRPDGGASRLFTNLNICQTIGGCRMVAVAPDASFFVATENVGNRLIAATLEGKVLWEQPGPYQATAVGPDRKIYSLTCTGIIYGADLVVFEPGGQISQTGKVQGFDLALDGKRGVLWLAGNRVRRYDLDFHLLTEFEGIGWCASSVDVGPDGSAWVTERDHPNVSQSTNRLLKFSAEGALVRATGLAWSPGCVRVDRSDGSVWVTGSEVVKSMTERLVEAIEKRIGRLPVSQKRRTALLRPRVVRFLCKFSPDGTLLREIHEGGHTLDIDQADGSVWLASEEGIAHFARDGRKLGKVGGASTEQRTVAVVPRRIENAER